MSFSERLRSARFLMFGTLATGAYVYGFYYLKIRPDPGRFVESIVALSPNALGDFAAGMFAPLAFLWLVVGYWMQSNELRLQREELQRNNRVLMQQVRLLADQLSMDYEVGQPKFDLQLGSVTGDGGWKFSVFNYGGKATNLVVVGEGTQKSILATSPVLQEGEPVEFAIEQGSLGDDQVTIRIEYVDQFNESCVSYWGISFKRTPPYTYPITDEFTPGPSERWYRFRGWSHLSRSRSMRR